MRRVTGSPRIADFRFWTRPEVAILVAYDQYERGLWDENVVIRIQAIGALRAVGRG